MKTNAAFAVISLAGVAFAEESAIAKKLNQEKMQLFMDWTTREGKNYANKAEFDFRQGLWQKTDEIIEASNKRSRESGNADPLVLAHNITSDMTQEEKEKLLSYKAPPGVKAEAHRQNRHVPPQHGIEQSRGKGRKLCVEGEVDWVKAGKVHAVKDQGYCGSCYAFGALTVLESKIAMARDEAPMHLAEQQIVDCAHYDNNDRKYYTWGCNGGWPVSVWQYARDFGMMLDSDYPYKARDQNCQLTQPHVEFDLASYNWHTGSPEPIEQIVDDLTNGPISVALQANCDAFFNYSSGVVRQSDCPLNRIDHAVVLTGYMPQTDEPYEYSYYVGGQERKATLSGEEAVWTIQNSWSDYWGQGGFIKVAVEEGHGFGFMNSYLEKMEVANIRINN